MGCGATAVVLFSFQVVSNSCSKRAEIVMRSLNPGAARRCTFAGMDSLLREAHPCSLNVRRMSMQTVSRRSAAALGLAAASVAVVRTASAQSPDSLAGKIRRRLRESWCAPTVMNALLSQASKQSRCGMSSCSREQNQRRQRDDGCHDLPHRRRRASCCARRQELYGYEELRLDLQQGHKRAVVNDSNAVAIMRITT